jgi:hypothetical protein
MPRIPAKTRRRINRSVMYTERQRRNDLPHRANWPYEGIVRRHFELKDDLNPGGHATAYLRVWDRARNEYVTDTNFEFEVHDELANSPTCGRGGRGGIAGEYGWAEKLHGAPIWTIYAGLTGLVRIRLEEDHPGRAIEFEVSIGRIDPDTDMWCFSADETPPRTYTAIDWWQSNSGPYPDTCSQGWARWVKSTEHGKLLHVVGMDCDAPDCEPCGS